MLILAFGTRPEALKLGPVAACLRDLDIPFLVLNTGQHDTLLKGTPAENDLWPAKELRLKSSGNVVRWCERAISPLKNALRDMGASTVVVQGDTMTAVAAARAARVANLPVVHIEAGVRSGNISEPWPEEGFRREITKLANWHYAATSTAYANLLSEGISQNHIRLTGNPIVSALARYAPFEAQTPPEAQILITMHRREWILSGNVPSVYQAFVEVAQENPLVQFVWPVHPAVTPHLPHGPWSANLQLIAPLPYKESIAFLAMGMGVMTDSGGLVEEAATLGVPSVILRTWNDRPEAQEAGVAIESPPTPEGVKGGAQMLLGGHIDRRPTTVYGHPDSAMEIARHLAHITQTTESLA